MPVCYFSVIGPGDACIFEYGKIADDRQQQQPSSAAVAASPLNSSTGGPQSAGAGAGTSQIPMDTLHLSRQFMTHSSLDLVEEAMWARPEFYLTKVDRFEDGKFFISAYVGFSPLKLLLMQDTEPHDNVRPFFTDAYELVIKYLSNPFASPTQPIRNREFEERLVMIYNKYF